MENLKASKRNEKGAKYIEYEANFDDEAKKQTKSLRAAISTHLHNAACKMKPKDYNHVKKLCTKILSLAGRSDLGELTEDIILGFSDEEDGKVTGDLRIAVISSECVDLGVGQLKESGTCSAHIAVSVEWELT
ncbi:70 kDa peptidyl-prolyl isomerase [Tanacetum coccineum]